MFERNRIDSRPEPASVPIEIDPQHGGEIKGHPLRQLANTFLAAAGSRFDALTGRVLAPWLKPA